MNKIEKTSKMLILGSKMTSFCYFGHNMNFLSNSKIVNFNHFLMPVIRYNFRKTYGIYLERSSEIMSLGPKNAHLLHFGYGKNFPQKSNHFKPLSNDYHQVKCQKNLMSRLLRKTLKCCFGPRNTPFTTI